jgi:branched-chain amino acid transport system permease protein
VSARGAQRRVGVALGAVVAIGTLVAPLVLSRADLTIYVLLGTAAMVTVGVSLLMGYAGQVSLGQGAFYAVGAYTAGLMSVHDLPPLLGLICAPLAAAVVATLVGIPIMRLRGHYLAFATLAIQLILLSVVGQLDILGGDIGLQAIPRLGIGSAQLSQPRSYAWVTWAAVALVLVIARNVITSRAGRGLRALASSEVAAESCGVPVARYKLAVFALAAAFGGLAGGIYAFFLGYVAPSSFPVLLSVEFVVMAVIGGLGTIWGPVVGATAITVLVQALNAFGTRPGMPPYASTTFSYAVYAVLLVVVLLYLPRGLLPTSADRVRHALARQRTPDGVSAEQGGRTPSSRGSTET